MRRRHEQQPRPRRQRRRIEPVTIDGHGGHAGAGRAQHLTRPLVERILDDDAVAALDEHPRDQIERLLRAVDDDHLRGVAGNRSRLPQVRGDRLAQGGEAGGVAVVEAADRGPPRAAVQQPPPVLERKAVDVAAAVGEVVARRGRTLRRELHRRSHVRGEGAEAGQPRAHRRRPGAGRRGSQADWHEGAGAGAADDEPFREQLLIGEHDDRPRHAELLRQVACRRQRARRR